MRIIEEQKFLFFIQTCTILLMQQKHHEAKFIRDLTEYITKIKEIAILSTTRATKHKYKIKQSQFMSSKI